MKLLITQSPPLLFLRPS